MDNNKSQNGCGWFNLRSISHRELSWRIFTSIGTVETVISDKTENLNVNNGLAQTIKGVNGYHLVGYYSAYLDSIYNLPDYSTSLFIVIDDLVLGNDEHRPQLIFSRGIFTRKLEVLSGNRKIIIEYSWPFYKGLIGEIFADPLSYISKDIVSRVVEVCRVEFPDWIYN